MDEKRMALREHLVDLRKMITWCLLALVVGFAIGFWKVEWLMDLFIAPLPVENLVSYTPTEMFMADMKIAFFCGLIIALPVILASLAWFVSPGLTEREKFWVPIIVLVSLALFFIGFFVAYSAVLPIALKFFIGVAPTGIAPQISVADYLSFALNFIFIVGLLMQFPFFILLLLVTGFIPVETLAKQRKVVIIALIAIAFGLGAGMDIFTLAMLFGPIYLLFELSLFVGRKWRKHIDKKNILEEKNILDKKMFGGDFKE